MWLQWVGLWFFKEVEPIATTSMKKVKFGSMAGLNEAKTDQKFADNSYMVSVIMQ